MPRRDPKNEHEKNVVEAYQNLSRDVYQLACEHFERRGECGKLDWQHATAPSVNKRDILLWGNGHHMAQKLCHDAQQIFIDHLPEEERDLIVDQERGSVPYGFTERDPKEVAAAVRNMGWTNFESVVEALLQAVPYMSTPEEASRTGQAYFHRFSIQGILRKALQVFRAAVKDVADKKIPHV